MTADLNQIFEIAEIMHTDTVTNERSTFLQRIRRRLVRWWRTFAFRMILSHILVAILTSVLGVLLLVLSYALSLRNVSASDYRSVATLAIAEWMLGTPDGQPNPPPAILPPGFSLIVDANNTVIFSQGDTECRAGKKLTECAPQLVNAAVGERFFDVNGEQWAEVVMNTVTNQRVIAQRAPLKAELAILLPGSPVYGTWPVVRLTMITVTLIGLPIALILAWFWARPLAKKLSKLSDASRRFAAGDFSIRISDTRSDQIGQLGQQFNDMADTLEQNVSMLRDLAQRNAELAQRAEQTAIQAERIRLSRDLHDAIAQRLFSLSVSTASLPALIERDQGKGVEQAQVIASLAEQTLLDLRSLLVDLRPVNVAQRGLADALHTHCDEWQTAYQRSVDCTLMLTGKYIPGPVEDVIYRVTQEALNNIAKHAHANVVNVSLVEGQRQITLSVTDDGQGFDPAKASGSGQFGLLSMRERAQSVGGSLVIESDTARGTTVRLTLPIDKLAV